MRAVGEFCLILVFTLSGFAQTNEIGVGAGFGFYRDVPITAAGGTAQAGFGPRFALSAAGGRNWGEHFGAEARYTFQDGDTELKSGGREVNLDGDAHSVLGDLLVYATHREARFRPFGAIGLGVKVYRATEMPASPRSLGGFAALETASQARPLVTLGGGVKYALPGRWMLRLDLRDYMTPFPTRLVVPAPGARLSGWLHDFVPVLGISRTF